MPTTYSSSDTPQVSHFEYIFVVEVASVAAELVMVEVVAGTPIVTGVVIMVVVVAAQHVYPIRQQRPPTLTRRAVCVAAAAAWNQ